jgi:hypothetical protein
MMLPLIVSKNTVVFLGTFSKSAECQVPSSEQFIEKNHCVAPVFDYIA